MINNIGLKNFCEKHLEEAFELKFTYLRNYHKTFFGSFVSSSDEIINELKSLSNLFTYIREEKLINFLKSE